MESDLGVFELHYTYVHLFSAHRQIVIARGYNLSMYYGSQNEVVRVLS